MIELREEVAISPSGLFQISFPTWVGVPGCALVVAPLSISLSFPLLRRSVDILALTTDRRAQTYKKKTYKRKPDSLLHFLV